MRTQFASIEDGFDKLPPLTGQANKVVVVNPSETGLTSTAASALTVGFATSAGTATTAGAAPAGTLTGTTLAAGVTASSLTSVGTLTALAVVGTASITAESAVPLLVYRSDPAANVSIEIRNDTASWFVGQGAGGSFNVNTDAVVGVSPRLTLTTGGNLSVSGSVITTASTTSAAGLRLPHGSAPSAPTNGDMWTTTAGLFVRINGSTVGPLS